MKTINGVSTGLRTLACHLTLTRRLHGYYRRHRHSEGHLVGLDVGVAQYTKSQAGLVKP